MPTKSPEEIRKLFPFERKSLAEKSLRVNYYLCQEAVEALSWITNERQDLSIKKSIEFIADETASMLSYHSTNQLCDPSHCGTILCFQRKLDEIDMSNTTRKTVVVSESTKAKVDTLSSLYGVKTDNIASALITTLKDTLDMSDINAFKEIIRLIRSLDDSIKARKIGDSYLENYISNRTGKSLTVILEDLQDAETEVFLALEESLLSNRKNITNKHLAYVKELEASGFELPMYSLSGESLTTIFENGVKVFDEDYSL